MSRECERCLEEDRSDFLLKLFDYITLHCTYLLPAITPAINRFHCIKTGIAAWMSAVTLHIQGDHLACDEPPIDFKT